MGKSLIIAGSKPAHLYGYMSDENKADYAKLRSSIQNYIVENGITDVYTTMDIGAEQIGMEAAINAKAKGSPVRTHAMIPYSNQDEKWPDAQKNNYQKIVKYSDIEPITGKPYSKESGRERLNALRDTLVNQNADVLMVYDGNEEDKSVLYTYNALKKTARDNGLDAPKFLHPTTLEISDARPFPKRQRIVSKEAVEWVKDKANAVKNKNYQYSPEELTDMSNIWKAYLSKLTLRDEHKRDLLDRGFTEEQIDKFQYKSLPRTPDEANKIMDQLLSEGYDLYKAPGFTVAEDGGAYSTQVMGDAYFCPAWDMGADMLYGMQIRNCNKEEAKKYGKYMWFSANKDGYGLSSSQPAAFYEGKNPDIILITEGVLKCNLAFEAMGEEYSILGMAGVYGEKGLYPYDRRDLFKDKIVLECFDADFVKNKNVRAASSRIRNNLIDYYGAKMTARMTWDDAGKGIDDYVSDKNRMHEDVNFDLSRVITNDSTTEVISNEWGKPETVHKEIADVKDSPLANLKMHIDMAKVHAAGFKIQPKAETPQASTDVQAPVEETHEETPQEHAIRKKREHMNEWTGRREPIFRAVLPATVDETSQIVPDAGKFIITIPEDSKMDQALKIRSNEIADYASEILGLDETTHTGQQIMISKSVPMHGAQKAVVVMFNQFSDKSNYKNISGAIKGAIADTFYKENYTVGRSFPMSDTEVVSAIKQFADKDTKEIFINDPRKLVPVSDVKLNENLLSKAVADLQNDGMDGLG